MFKFYNGLLEKYPIGTKSLTSGSLFSVGDALTQFIFEDKPFSWKRNVDFFIMGATYIAPALHGWYCKLLPRIQAAVFPNSSKTVKVFGSMILDQLVFAPILMTGFYPYFSIVIEKDIKAYAKGIEQWRKKIGETMINNWKIWPLATTINFWFMPLQYQVLFANFVGLLWNMILSYIASK